MNILKHFLVIVCVLALGYALGRYVVPPKTITKQVEIIKRDVKIVERKITRPDGTIEETKETTDKTKEESNNTVVVDARSNWIVQAGVGTDFAQVNPIYAATISKRFLGPIFLGVSATTSGHIGAVISMEF